MQVWNVLQGARSKFRTQKWRQKSPSAHHRTTLSSCIFATKAYYINNRKKPVKQQYVLHMFSQYGELRPTNGWHRFGSLGALQQRASAKLCGVLQGNMEYLNFRTRRHLYSAGRPSRWASAYILVFDGVIYQKVIFEIVCRPITSSSNYIDITCISRWRIARERWSDFDVLFHANKVFTRGRLSTGLLFNTILNGSLQCPRGVVYILHYTPTVYN